VCWDGVLPVILWMLCNCCVFVSFYREIEKKKMRLIHVQGDLFSCPKHITLAHCISYDAKMSRGIAVLFERKFSLRNEIHSSTKVVGGVVALWRDTRYIANLITKWRCFQKPTLSDLQNSLLALRDFMYFNSLTEIAMPEIAAGLDAVPLNVVLALLTKIFQNTPVTIYMYHL